MSELDSDPKSIQLESQSLDILEILFRKNNVEKSQKQIRTLTNLFFVVSSLQRQRTYLQCRQRRIEDLFIFNKQRSVVLELIHLRPILCLVNQGRTKMITMNEEGKY